MLFKYMLMGCIVRNVLDLVVWYAFQKVVCTVCCRFSRNRKGEPLLLREKEKVKHQFFFLIMAFLKWWGTTGMAGVSKFQGVSRSLAGHHAGIHQFLSILLVYTQLGSLGSVVVWRGNKKENEWWRVACTNSRAFVASDVFLIMSLDLRTV